MYQALEQRLKSAVWDEYSGDAAKLQEALAWADGPAAGIGEARARWSPRRGMRVAPRSGRGSSAEAAVFWGGAFCVKILLFFAFFVKPFKRRKGFPDLTLFSHGALPRRRSRGRGAIRGDAVARAHHER